MRPNESIILFLMFYVQVIDSLINVFRASWIIFVFYLIILNMLY